MKSFLYLLTLAAAISIPALTQEPATPPVEQQTNAASGTKDNSGISGDQVTKPAGAKGTTLIGCLSGPDTDGKYELRSMQHRTGVQVLGPDDLKNDSGSKVKLTGAWEALPQQSPQTKAKEARRFQVTAVEVLSPHCTPPARKRPSAKRSSSCIRSNNSSGKSNNSKSRRSEQASPKQ